jgi:hypothetical protein
MADDRVAAELAAIREDFRVTADLERLGGYKTHTAALRHGTALLAAVEAVLALHRPGFEMCVDALWCQECGVETDWPCKEYQAISSALLGEAGTDA